MVRDSYFERILNSWPYLMFCFERSTQLPCDTTICKHSNFKSRYFVPQTTIHMIRIKHVALAGVSTCPSKLVDRLLINDDE
jgi:hypothetical protein